MNANDPNPPAARTLILIFSLSWLAFLLCWWFAFFTSAGWRLFTDLGIIIGRAPFLAMALWEAHRAGAGPTPAPPLLALAMFFPMFGYLAWALPRVLAYFHRPHDPLEPFRPRQTKGFGDALITIVMILFLAETMFGFPAGLALIGHSILYAAWPALAYGSMLVLVMSLMLSLSLSWPRRHAGPARAAR